MLHAGEFGRLHQLQMKALKHLPFCGFDQRFVTFEQIVDNFTAMVFFANNTLAQGSVSLTVGILDTPKVCLQAYRKLMDLANAFDGLLPFEHFKFTALYRL